MLGTGLPPMVLDGGVASWEHVHLVTVVRRCLPMCRWTVMRWARREMAKAEAEGALPCFDGLADSGPIADGFRKNGRG